MTILLDLDQHEATTTDEITSKLSPRPPLADAPAPRPRLVMRWQQNWADGRYFCTWIVEDRSA
ncbi:MAG TPA: hypothetical protein VHS58_07625 [Acetobacteraceae bacterium]|jgi:hypothetical protein|nr:hypothetical protein [Acetobacteraceae bacterium]